MAGERFTDAGGLRAIWRVRHGRRGRIEVSAVYDTGVIAGRIVEFAPGTDLVDARECFPRWNRLWDLVQHEFWAEIAASAGCAPLRTGQYGRGVRNDRPHDG